MVVLVLPTGVHVNVVRDPHMHTYSYIALLLHAATSHAGGGVVLGVLNE